jgi:hypothetical protein
MTFDELLDYKLKLHHLHRDYNIEKDAAKDPSKLNRLYRAMLKIDILLKNVYTEMESRKPGQNIASY